MTTEQWRNFEGDAFTGFDTDRTMLRLSAMNLMLHSISNPHINYADRVSKRNDISDAYDVILANPPFTGTVDAENANQIAFVNKVIDYIEQNGYVESIAELTRPPFDKPQSFIKLFDEDKRKEFVDIVNEVKDNATRIIS